ncbi:MAG: DUF11 domain-containing protein [bacterium]|jgi:uncharacterized repeat protein (TIGR01451 family)
MAGARLALVGLCCVAVIAVAVPFTVFADGTASGTDIDNTATLDYQVGGIDQTQLSSFATFKVDNKVDLTVVTQDGGEVTVLPGSLFGDGVYNVLHFRVSNDGNTAQDCSLSVVTVATGSAAKFGGTDAFDMTPEPVPEARIFVNSVMDVAGTYDNGTDTDNYIDELPADSFFDVFVVLDAPLTAADGQIASYHLVASVHDAGLGGTLGDLTTADTGAWDSGTVQVVFADAAGTAPGDGQHDGRHSDQDDYEVNSADLAVNKSSAVISDPFSSSNPKAIPGATIRYTIDIANTGGADAQTVTAVDQIPANTTFVGGSVATSNSNGGATITVEYSADGVVWQGAETSPVAYVRVTNSVVDATNGTAQMTFDVTVD